MASPKVPKAVLFDIGGVVVGIPIMPIMPLYAYRPYLSASQVLSPFQGILDFEQKNGVPRGWINFAIRYHSPNGHWQQLERGEIELDKDFFAGFTKDLHDTEAWREFHSGFRNDKKRIKDIANPTQLGDHVSLKAEAVDSKSNEQDPISNYEIKDGEEQWPRLSKLAQDTTIGDPTSLESENVVEPNDKTGSNPFPSSKPDTSRPSSTDGNGLPTMPEIDGEKLFWGMISASREADPYMFPALKHMKQQKRRPIVGALSNTVTYPPDHEFSKPRGSASGLDPFFSDLESMFDVYVASAKVGMRKPSRGIYELAMRRLNEHDRANGGQGINPEEVVFLDDIGENLKAAKQIGMRTIKVQLGKTWRAVKELENVTGIELMDDKTRRSKL